MDFNFLKKITCILKNCLEWFILYGLLKFINHYVIPHLINDIVVDFQFNMTIWTFKKWHIHKKWATLTCNHSIICLYEEPFHTFFSCFPWSHLQTWNFCLWSLGWPLWPLLFLWNVKSFSICFTSFINFW